MILRSDELDTAQSVFQLLKTLAWVLPILALAAFGLAVWLARDRRRAVRGIGFVVLAVGLLGLVAARLTRNYVVDSLVARRDDREAASNAWDILTELMRGSFRLMLVVGLLFLLAAWLAGPGRRALTARGWLAPALQGRVWAYVVLGLVGAFLLFTSEVADSARLLTVALLMALGATWIELDAPTDARRVPRRAGHGVLRRHVGARHELVGRATRGRQTASSGAAPATRRSGRTGGACDRRGIEADRARRPAREWRAHRRRVRVGEDPRPGGRLAPAEAGTARAVPNWRPWTRTPFAHS